MLPGIVCDAFVMVSGAGPSVAIRQIRERRTGIAVLASLRRLAFLFLSLFPLSDFLSIIGNKPDLNSELSFQRTGWVEE